MTITASVNLARFSVIVPILLHAFFNTSSRLLGAMLHNVSAHMHDNLIYSVVVLVVGSGLGIATLELFRRNAERTDRAITRSMLINRDTTSNPEETRFSGKSRIVSGIVRYQHRSAYGGCFRVA